MTNSQHAPNCKKYGVPLYGAAWAPSSAIRSDPKHTPADLQDKEDESSGADGAPTPVSAGSYVVLSGGGGEGRSGIPNAVLVARFDSASNSLSDQPVARIGTGADLPYRMAVHPRGDCIICSFPEKCRQFTWEAFQGNNGHELRLKSTDEDLIQLQDIEQQLALTFSNDGSLLALGGEDGKLRLFKWPSMEIVLDEANAHTSVRDLDFSSDMKFLVSAGNGVPVRIWDVTSSKAVASLSKDENEVLGFCRFSDSGGKQVLYTTSMRGEGGSIVSWDTSKWKRVSSKLIVRQPISAFDVSADGKVLALGTAEGDVVIVNSTNMRKRNIVKKAHLGPVTAVKFSQDSRALVSASMDSSARVTLLVMDETEKGLSLWLLIFVVLIAVAVYYMKTEGFLR